MRPILPAVRGTKQGQWPRLDGYSLEGKTIGLLGLGAIGKETAKRLAGFGCQLLAYDMVQDEPFTDRYKIAYCSLNEILARADVISLHLPATDQTRGMVDGDFLSEMKPGSWLVNTSRGELVREEDLVDALRRGHLRGAAVDAYQEEPPPEDHPFLKMENILTTPHMGAHSDSAKNTMGRMAMRECLAVLRGEQPRYQVN